MNKKVVMFCLMLVALPVACSSDSNDGSNSQSLSDMMSEMTADMKDVGEDVTSSDQEMDDQGGTDSGGTEDSAEMNVADQRVDDAQNDMLECGSNEYLSESDTPVCMKCPELDWTCESLEAVVRDDFSSTNFYIDFETVGYAKAKLFGSYTVAQGGGGSFISPFQVEGAFEIGSLVFDLSDYQQGEILVLGVEFETECNQKLQVRLNLPLSPENSTVGSASCPF